MSLFSKDKEAQEAAVPVGTPTLSSFFKQNAQQTENVFYVASKRFVDEAGKPIQWEIKAITSTEDEALRKASMVRVQVPGKRNQYTQDVDFNKYACKLLAACTVYPNLDDKELQDSYGALGAEAVIKAMLTPGEYNEYLSKVQEVNGYNASMEELVDEAKN